MMLMLIMKLLKRTLLKKVLPILRYILRRKILKGKFVENGLEKKSKTDWTKMILKGKVLTQTKR